MSAVKKEKQRGLKCIRSSHARNTFIMLGTASTVTINNKHKWMISIKMSLCRDMDFLDTGGKLPVTGNLITLENAPHTHTHGSRHLIWCSGLQWWELN